MSRFPARFELAPSEYKCRAYHYMYMLFIWIYLYMDCFSEGSWHLPRPSVALWRLSLHIRYVFSLVVDPGAGFPDLFRVEFLRTNTGIHYNSLCALASCYKVVWAHESETERIPYRYHSLARKVAPEPVCTWIPREILSLCRETNFGRPALCSSKRVIIWTVLSSGI